MVTWWRYSYLVAEISVRSASGARSPRTKKDDTTRGMMTAGHAASDGYSLVDENDV